MNVFDIRKIPETASTNDDAKAAAEAGAAEGRVIWALRQTSGRGRQGRVWESPEGNLYASTVLRPGCEVWRAGSYGFAAALAVHDTVQALLPESRVALKWPNDVLVDGKKISGILLEASPTEDGIMPWLVVGIGINVEHAPAGALYPATSLREAGASPPDLGALLDRLLASLWRWKTTLEAQGFAPLRTAWLDRAQQGTVSVRLPDGTVEGEFAGLEDTGSLILQLADGSKKAIATGDVFFLPPERGRIENPGELLSGSTPRLSR